MLNLILLNINLNFRNPHHSSHQNLHPNIPHPLPTLGIASKLTIAFAELLGVTKLLEEEM
jgi:hypothetical protein